MFTVCVTTTYKTRDFCFENYNAAYELFNGYTQDSTIMRVTIYNSSAEIVNRVVYSPYKAV